jgi:asparagine synthase (glutamine-hydrolysing)
LYLDNFAVFPRAIQQSLLTSSVLQQLGELDPYREAHRALSSTDATSTLNKLLYTDTKIYLHELLMKQDQMSMAASIESRVPFLDRDLVEFTTRMPERMKLRGWTTKYVLRKAMSGIVPEPILRRRKLGFPVPVGKWFRGESNHVISHFVLGERVWARGIFRGDVLARLAAEHASEKADHTQRLWTIVNLEIWLRHFVDGESIEDLRAALVSPATARQESKSPIA